MAEMFLKLDGIQGESLDEASPVAHKDEIELTAWSWNTTTNVTWKKNQGGQSADVDFHEVEITKIADKATVTLYQCCVTGKHIASGKLTCRKNDGDQKLEYLILDMKDIIVNSVAFEGAGNDLILNEKVKLSFAEFKIEYKVQQDLGSGGAGVQFGYNIQKMKAA